MDYPGLKRIRGLLQARGFKPNRRRGQNFLFDPNILKFMVSRAGLTADDLVLEVGFGPGGLTWAVLQSGARVVAVEIDAVLYRACRKLFDQYAPDDFAARVQWLEGDFLAGKNRINPEVLETLQQDLARQPGKKLKVLSNLPYCIATPAIMNILECEVPWEIMLLTVQDEVGQRLLADPGCRAYGKLTVLVSAIASVELEKRLGAGAFWPKPEVESVILKIAPRAEPLIADPEEYKRFKTFVTALFAYKRKRWCKSLRMGLTSQAARDIETLPERSGVDAGERAENLSLSRILHLFHLYDAEHQDTKK